MGEHTEAELDAARDVRRAVAEFGLSEAELGRILDGEDPPETEDAVLDSILDFGAKTFGGGSAVVREEKGNIVHSILTGRPARIQQDYGYRERDLLAACDFSEIGYDFEWERFDGEEIDAVTSNSHPEAIRLCFTETETGETTEIAFRYPPGNDRWASNNEKALFRVINREFLRERGYEFVELNTYSGWMVYFLMAADRIETLREKYGDAIEIFGFEMCHEQSLRERALNHYDPDGYLDHEAEYGAPEPPETVTVSPE